MSDNMPLKGVNVLDFTIAMAGPLASQRLGDMGAEVIKVESFGGDLTRVFALQDLWLDGDTTSYLALNRNKKSAVINLKTLEGREIVHELARRADVVVQNFRPGVTERLGIGYEDLRRVNPAIVYASISGYGTQGPMRDAPGQDLLVQAFSGLTFSGGPDNGMPHPAPTYFVDTCASHLATEGILAALLERTRTGEGQHVETNLLSAALEAECQEVMTCLRTGEDARRTPAPYASAWLDPPYAIYATKDAWLALPQNDMKAIARVVESEALARHLEARPDPANHDAIDEWRSRCYELLAECLCEKTTEQWLRLMTPQKIWCGAVQSIGAVVAHPQAAYHLASFEHPVHGRVRCVAPAITFSGTPELPMGPPPGFGQHTEEVLRGLGYAPDAIARLREAGVVR